MLGSKLHGAVSRTTRATAAWRHVPRARQAWQWAFLGFINAEELRDLLRWVSVRL